MRVPIGIAALLLSGAAAAQTPPVLTNRTPDWERRAARALERADERLEYFNRGMDLERENFGRQGRINATSDAARNAEQPRAVHNEWSPWARW